MKSRFIHVHREVNEGKLASLEALYGVYRTYLQSCIDLLLEKRCTKMPRGQFLGFFPGHPDLTVHLRRGAEAQALGLVSSWFTQKYSIVLKKQITSLKREGKLSNEQAKSLYTVGKFALGSPWNFVTQEHIDFYWSWLLDEGIVGRRPSAPQRPTLVVKADSAKFKYSGETKLTSWWLTMSCLVRGHPIELPLSDNHPFVKSPSDLNKDGLLRQNKKGQWVLQLVDKTPGTPIEVVSEEAPKLGLDVGLNVMAATSDGRLRGQEMKPRFNRTHDKVKALRANRQRHGLKLNSPKLDYLESKLTEMMKNLVGRTANELVRDYPGTVFVVEDLDLSGCRGQKRFAYKGLLRSLESKANVIKVNPAYTSQGCPSCGYISRKNRVGVKFHCRGCGRKSHADIVGARGILGRSEDKSITCDTDVSEVKGIVRRRYAARRRSPAPPLTEEPLQDGLESRLEARCSSPDSNSSQTDGEILGA